ncbi:MAG: hypothetical protein EBX76_00455 [Acidimicrobiia bacterium]|nr:hypothetical protein [Acidimicrobiia bacterium]
MSLESRDEFLAGVRSLYERWGTNKYDEQVSQIEHAVQCAQHARDDGADAALVVATVLRSMTSPANCLPFALTSPDVYAPLVLSAKCRALRLGLPIPLVR